MKSPVSHSNAVLQAILVTFLWSTSWILIKIGLRNSLPAITFAGLRYVLAFICLAPFIVFNPVHRQALKNITRRDWLRLCTMGLVYITLTQGAMYLALSRLPANTLTLILNLTSIFVGIAGIFTLKENPSWLQWLGIGIAITGIFVYFIPIDLPGTQIIGIIFSVGCLLMNVASSLLGREVNRRATLSPIIITFLCFGFGSIPLLLFGLVFQGTGTLSWKSWLVIIWLAVINSALAFTLWNRSLQTLSAVESSILNSLMMPQITVLAWFFLKETPSSRAIVGLILVGAGTLIVQLKQGRNK